MYNQLEAILRIITAKPCHNNFGLFLVILGASIFFIGGFIIITLAVFGENAVLAVVLAVLGTVAVLGYSIFRITPSVADQS